MAVVIKKKNGILYFIGAVVVLALGACIFFMVQKDIPTGASSGANFSDEGESVVVSGNRYEAEESVLGLDKEEKKVEELPSDSVLGMTDSTAKAPEAEGKKDDSNQLSSIVQKMIGNVAGYFSASSPEKRLGYVLYPEIIEAKMKEYYARVPFKAGKVSKMNMPAGMALGGYAYWRVQGTLEDGSPFFIAMRIVDGEPKIDWESEVRYSDFDWEEWVDDPDAKEGEFRVYAKIDAVYEPPFSDNERYRCLQLKAMNASRTIFAYIDMNDFDQKEFYNTLESTTGGNLECLLRLEKAKAKEVKNPTARILKVVSPAWINPHSEEVLKELMPGQDDQE